MEHLNNAINNGSQQVLINNNAISIIEYKGQPVLTFNMIDDLHERTDGTARKRFTDNKSYFQEGKHFFSISKSQKSEFRTLEIPNRGITLITQKGYLLIAKSLTDDLAWKVQEELIDGYFSAKNTTPTLPDFSDPENALKFALQTLQESKRQALQIEQQKEKIEEMAPKAAIHDMMIAAKGSFSFGQAANILAACGVVINSKHIGRTMLTTWLRDNNYIQGYSIDSDGRPFKGEKWNRPFQAWMKYFDVKPTSYVKPSGEIVKGYSVRIVFNGVLHLGRKFGVLDKVKDYLQDEIAA